MNSLMHAQQFQSLLKDYRVDPKQIMAISQVRFVQLVAPTSTGRNTIIRTLVQTGDYYFIVSDTTRKPRLNDGVMELNGREYWFRSEAQMLRDIAAGKYLEAAIIHNQQVSGTSIRELKKAGKLNKIAITDAEVAGAEHAASIKPDTLPIFVVPPSFEEWQRRIHQRGSMEQTEYMRRMQSAYQECQVALSKPYFKFVINDSVENAAEQINQIAKLDIVDPVLQDKARSIIEQLIVAISTSLRLG